MAPGVSIISDFPVSYWLAGIVLGSFAIEAGVRIREKWSVPALMVYLTVFGWYMVEPIISSEMRDFPSEAISGGYICVLIFVCAFRLFCTPIAKAMAPQESMAINARDIPVETVLIVTTVIWLVLLAYGTARMDGDLFAALFPVEARSGNSMWLRAAGADAGKLGFVVSVAGYMYTLVLSLFGMILPILKRRSYQILCILLILISWPYAFLQGSRNIALAVFIPMIFSFVFFSKIRVFMKILIAICAAFFLEWSMRQIISYRNFGFDYRGEIENIGHSGLNMATELIYCRSFVENEVLQRTYGSHILADMLNFIPRVIWTDKPLLGIDYAIARGYGGGTSDIGVVATISSGMIGQGVLEFGPYIGPIFSAMLMALWSGWLSRLYAQGTVTRVCLFLVGMGLTFNLGRNITLLVLWPMVFAFGLVLVLEYYARRRRTLPDRVAFDL